MNIGIEKMSFYVPYTYVRMSDLAEKRGVDPNKYVIGLGQDEMAVVPFTQDTITLGANAAAKILNDDDKKAIDLVFLATESGVDQSKAGAVTIHRLLGINPRSRSIEIKEACYSAAFAIHSALGHIMMNPTAKVLIIASDISRYGIGSAGEPTQGAGAVAMLMSADPKILRIEKESTAYSDDISDFWRPNYSSVALVDGKYSTQQYNRFFEQTFNDYIELTKRQLNDFDALLFHIPYTKQGLKALRLVADEEKHDLLYHNFQLSTLYNRRVGNIYTASLFLSLISLLDYGNLEAGSRLGLYSYGSGAVAEFFSGVLVEGYKEHLVKDHEEMLNERLALSVAEYEANYEVSLPQDGSKFELKRNNDSGKHIFIGVENHIRNYE